MKRRRLLALGASTLTLLRLAPAMAQSFDHRHEAWGALLGRHVVLFDQGRASALRYAALAAERPALQAYLASLSGVGATAFAGFTRGQQMAFLINAYNAFTAELILTRYPKLASIRDLGGLFQSPWKLKFVPLLGAEVSLDGIEHEMLRVRGRYDDPRIHFAVNCASIGCPMLREEAFVAERLDAQLAQQSQRFMADRSRNRWNPASQRLELSKIFDWYGENFRLGHLGIGSVEAFCARHADVLADAPAERERIRAQRANLAFLDYDWRLNDAR